MMCYNEKKFSVGLTEEHNIILKQIADDAGKDGRTTKQ